MEFCSAGSVYDILAICQKTLSEDQISCVLRQVIKGLKHIHGFNMIHRDVKCGNILLLEDGSARLADFGVSAQLSDTMSKRKTVIGTP
jgi:serine/threonine protein kinase